MMNSRLTQLVRDDKGQTAIEYALIVGLVLTILIAVVGIVLPLVSGSIGGVNTALVDDNSQSLPTVVSSEVSTRAWTRSLYFIPLLIVGVSGLWALFRVEKKRSVRRVVKTRKKTADQLRCEQRRIATAMRSNRHHPSWALQLSHVMETVNEVLPPTASRESVIESLRCSPSAVVIIEPADDDTVGVISHVELLASSGTIAREIAIPAVMLPENTMVSAAVRMIQCDGIDKVVVTRERKVAGVVTQRELNSTLLTSLQLISEIDEEYRQILLRTVSQ